MPPSPSTQFKVFTRCYFGSEGQSNKMVVCGQQHQNTKGSGALNRDKPSPPLRVPANSAGIPVRGEYLELIDIGRWHKDFRWR